MTEERKFAILFAATILAARKLIDLDRDKPNMAKGFFVDRAIEDAAFVLERIDARWPSIVNSFSAKEPPEQLKNANITKGKLPKPPNQTQ